MPLFYSPSPRIPTWTSTSRNLFIYQSNVSWIPISDTHIPHSDFHQDFGLILSEDLCWDKHYRAITACANKVLGLKCHTFLFCHLTSTMVILYVSLIQSQFFTVLKYGIPITLNMSSSVLPTRTEYILNDYQLLWNSFDKTEAFPLM